MLKVFIEINRTDKEGGQGQPHWPNLNLQSPSIPIRLDPAEQIKGTAMTHSQ